MARILCNKLTLWPLAHVLSCSNADILSRQVAGSGSNAADTYTDVTFM
jgi:hypothetical protein